MSAGHGKSPAPEKEQVNQSMTCKFCGASMEDGQTVCPLCGTEQSAEVSAETTAAPETAAEQPEETVAAIPETKQEAPVFETDAPSETKTPGGKRSPWLVVALIVVAVAAVAALAYAVVSMVGKKSDETPSTVTEETAAPEDGQTESETGSEETETNVDPAMADPNDPTTITNVDEAGNYVAHSYTKANADITAEDMAAVVATCGDMQLTNGQLAYYFGQQYYSFMSTYGSYAAMFGLDTTLPLSEQMYDDTHTWEDFFLQSAMRAFWQTAAVNAEATKAGFQMDEDTAAYVESMGETITSEAETNGFASADEYLQSVYGPYVTLDEYLQFGRDMMQGSAYLSQQFGSIAYTEDDIVNYFRENQATYASQNLSEDDPKMVNVRHILITVEPDENAETDESGQPILTEQNWKDAELKAQELLDLWKSGEATEESFAQLAQEHSDDPGSVDNGGLYEEVYPGEMVTEFNDWCFDSARKPGDTGIVCTDYGYHIMYFVGTCDHAYWYTVAEQDYVSQRQQEMLQEMQNATPVSVDYSKVVLAELNLG